MRLQWPILLHSGVISIEAKRVLGTEGFRNEMIREEGEDRGRIYVLYKREVIEVLRRYAMPCGDLLFVATPTWDRSYEASNRDFVLFTIEKAE